MRAILIDPEKKTVTEIQLSGDDYREINRVLHCKCHTSGAFLSGSIEKGFDGIYVSDDVDDEQLANEEFWFQVDADRNPPSSYPIAGCGLALGTDSEGAGCDVRISVDDLAKRITFTRRKFRGFTTQETRTGIVVTMDAPIIDA